eukprot:3599400-Pyramimonas_sp.AAC.1
MTVHGQCTNDLRRGLAVAAVRDDTRLGYKGGCNPRVKSGPPTGEDLRRVEGTGDEDVRPGGPQLTAGEE